MNCGARSTTSAITVAVLVALAAVSLGVALLTNGDATDAHRSVAPVAGVPIPTKAPAPTLGPTFGSANFATIPQMYVEGTVVAASPHNFAVHNASGTSEYPLDDWTQICRRTCDETWPALEIGSRVDGVVDFLTTGPHARWLNVNSWSDWARIDAVEGDHLVLRTTRLAPQVSGPYTLVLGPATAIDPPGALRVGDLVYVTGSSKGADDRSEVFAILISRSR